MKTSATAFNSYLLFKLPAAFFCGVRVKEIHSKYCETTVTFHWINQNPFKSIYFAVLAMAAELATGALLLHKIKLTDKQFSTLVVGMKADFTKKAIGKIRFEYNNHQKIEQSIQKAISTKKWVEFTLTSTGINEKNEPVARFDFYWSILLKP